jgi:hypothetical protein
MSVRTPNFDNFPDELKGYRHWVCWKATPKPKGSGFNKIPIVAGTGEPAKSNDPSTWRSYEEAVEYYEANRVKLAGIGYVLSEKDPFTGGDIDHCRDPQTGELDDRAKKLLQRFDTYSEISPSDTGVRFFCRGKLPGTGKAKDGVELYDRGRFLTITGGWIGEYSGKIEDRSKEVFELYRELGGVNGNGTEVVQNPLGWQDGIITGVGAGARHASALRLAARWAAKGMSEKEIVHFILTWNQKNRPPKPELSDPNSKELRDIVDYVMRGKELNQETAITPFPTAVMAGVAGDFARLYGSYLESPPEFFFMAFLTCLGSILSGRVTLESELRPQPRLFTLLLGQSADDRKSTALSKAVGFFLEAMTDFPTCWGVGSAEGLQKKFEESNNLLLCFDEFKQFVSKCRIQSSVLLPCTTTLFESNAYENRTKKTEVELRNAHLSILGASTVQTYEACWDSQFTDIGFNNRLFLVPGNAKRRFSFPPKIPDLEKQAIKKKLQNALAHSGSNYWEIPIIPDAKELYHNWYLSQETGSVHTKRLDTYAMRLMILLTVNETGKSVTPEIVQKAITLCDWQKEMRQLHDPVDADSVTAKIEEKIRRALSKGPKTDRELKQRTNANRAGLWFYESAKKNLQIANEVFFDKKIKRWRLKA